VKLSAVGDVVHTLPALNALRGVYPAAHIAWAVQPGAANLLDGHTQLDELIILPRKLSLSWSSVRHVKEQLRAGGAWDFAVDFQGLTKSGAVARLSGAPVRIGFAGAESRELNRFFVNAKVAPEAGQVVQKNIGLLAPLGVSPGAPAQAHLHVTEDDRQRIEDWANAVEVRNERFVVLDPFAGWQTKLWPRDRWVAVAKELFRVRSVRSLIFHGPGEQQNAEALAREIGAQARPVVAPPSTLREYTALLQSHALAVIAADTGPMHIAAAAGVPCVALYGPSDSRRNAPAFANAKYKVLQDFTQPCAATFARKCKFHPPGMCMGTITSEAVLGSLDELLPV
jgi:lipopolysaccharide heptosyltransferase I